MPSKLQPIYWNNRYNAQETAWDLGACSPPLQNYINQLKNKAIAILIPGCGNAHEAAYLLAKGFTNITLIDISEVLVKSLQNKFKGQNIVIKCVDFFEFTGSFDLILEQTFFCALVPALRKSYVNKMASLLKPGKKLVGLLFNKEFETDGPPFGGTTLEYETLFKEKFEIKTMQTAYNSAKPRENNELFINLVKI